MSIDANGQTVATAEPDRQRFEAITDRIPDDVGRILDVGCVRHDQAKRAYGNLHAHLYTHYPDADIVGIDRDSPETQSMQSPGYDIRCVDCQNVSLEGEFDVIVAGEVIEHLPNPGQFLERAAAHLADDGRIIATTPNPDSFTYWIRACADNWTSADHTCWISPQQLGTICARSGSGLAVSDVEYLPPMGRVSSLAYRHWRDRTGATTYLAVIE